MLKRALYVILASAVLLEVVLQLIALGVWFSEARDQPSEPAEILCVGDSFTHGSGASSIETAYPSRLEHHLRTEGRPWKVINGGWGGQDSRAVLERLPQQLTRFEPKVVCIVIGCNDRWSRPDPVARSELSDQTDDGYRFELRTLRFLRLLRGFGAFDSEGDSLSPVIGRWKAPSASTTYEFDSDGSVSIGGATTSMAWTAESTGRLRLHSPAFDQEFDVRRVGSGLVLSPVTEGTEILLVPDDGSGASEDGSDLVRARAAVAVKDWVVAERIYRKVLDGARQDPAGQREARVGLTRSLVGLGRIPEARASAAPFLDAPEHDAETREAALQVTQALGDHASAEEHARALIALDPDHIGGWTGLGYSAFHTQPKEAAIGVIERALEHVPPQFSQRLWMLRASLVRSDRTELPRVIARSWKHTQHRPFLRQLLELNPRVDRAGLRTAWSEINGAGTWSIAEEALAANTEDTHSQVLREHLELMVELCQDAGARPILGGYPFANPHLEGIYRDVAERTGATYVSCAPRFAATREAEPEVELFVSDGHCNDAGYDLMATIFADRIQQLPL